MIFRYALLLRWKWKCLLTWAATIQHDSSLKIWADAGTELQRAREIAVLTERVLTNARTDEQLAAYAIARLDRQRVLGI